MILLRQESELLGNSMYYLETLCTTMTRLCTTFVKEINCLWQLILQIHCRLSVREMRCCILITLNITPSFSPVKRENICIILRHWINSYKAYSMVTNELDIPWTNKSRHFFLKNYLRIVGQL